MILTGEKLEEKLIQTYSELEIDDKNIGSLNACLGMVKGKDIPTYEHCVRVGLVGKDVCEFMHQDPKILFYSGILHDTGKILTNAASLKKNKGFNEKDREELKKHPKDGYMLLKNIHRFSAEVLLRHHLFQDKPYPEYLPPFPEEFSESTKAMINYFARILALVDFYDSASTRKNDKFIKGKPRYLTRDEVKEIMFEHNIDQKYFLGELYNEEIF